MKIHRCTSILTWMCPSLGDSQHRERYEWPALAERATARVGFFVSLLLSSVPRHRDLT